MYMGLAIQWWNAFLIHNSIDAIYFSIIFFSFCLHIISFSVPLVRELKADKLWRAIMPWRKMVYNALFPLFVARCTSNVKLHIFYHLLLCFGCLLAQDFDRIFDNEPHRVGARQQRLRFGLYFCYRKSYFVCVREYLFVVIWKMLSQNALMMTCDLIIWKYSLIWF